ncbi:cation diffusion facilitator family transporter [candidate division KSB1 bacterium]|nr:cation diffusion facilitator family transporter [candidate division KSB1 bacterium]
MKSKDTSKNIKIAFFLNFSFTILEFIGGFLTNSLAIFSNALHDLGDNFSLGLSWFLDKFSKREKTDRFSYGYRRFSLLAALLNTIILIIGSVIILWEAIPRIIHPQHSDAQGMLTFAILGIVVNGIAVLKLRTGQSMNEQVITWHLLEDVLGWTAVLIAAIILYFRDIHIIDPLLSVAITGYVLFNVIRKLIKTLSLFLQGVPDKITLSEIEQILTSINKVVSTHHTHVWSLDGENHVLSTHVTIEKDSTKEDVISIKCQILESLQDMNFEHTTIEIEYEDEVCKHR